VSMLQRIRTQSLTAWRLPDPTMSQR
jgi:hypothetical protein